MALRDSLASEANDARAAAAMAAAGRSQTGFSGRHTEMPADGPIAGRLVDQPRVLRMGTAADLGPDAPLRQPEPPLIRRHAPMEGERVPFEDTELKMAWPGRPGFRRYWFNDTPGRIARARRAGYAHVIDPETGQHAEIISDRTGPSGRRSYLMELPMKFYQEDMAANAQKLAGRLDDIRNGRAGPGASDNRYIPSSGIQIVGR